jgi:hypothetical protein
MVYENWVNETNHKIGTSVIRVQEVCTPNKAWRFLE